MIHCVYLSMTDRYSHGVSLVLSLWGIHSRRISPFSIKPIVQVIAKSVATKYYRDKPFKVHTLNVVDGDDKMVVVKINTVLNDSTCQTQEGGVVKLTDYAPLFFDYNKGQQINNVVLLNNFSISDLPVWNIPSEFEDMPPPESRLRTSEEDENCAAFAARLRKNATDLGNGGGGYGEGGGVASGVMEGTRVMEQTVWMFATVNYVLGTE